MKNYLGKKFGNFFIVELIGQNKFSAYIWKGRCKCGKEKIGTGASFKSKINNNCPNCNPKEKINPKIKNPIFYPKPKRRKTEIPLDRMDIHRKFDCIFYVNCLDHSAVFDWISFSCKNCIHYSKKEERSDETQCKNLIHYIFKEEII